ncbi:MAG: hypothetical protein KAY37_01055 [Phycisphaerae bacterium]|nr:hypothetical protein [Phycisphaerae bacterium]
MPGDQIQHGRTYLPAGRPGRGEGPLLVTAREAELLRRLLRRRTFGRGGVVVTDHRDTLTITGRMNKRGSAVQATFPARITGWELVPDQTARWRYSWRELILSDDDSYVVKPDGRSGGFADPEEFLYALNSRELSNTTMGVGAVMEGAIVTMEVTRDDSGRSRWMFDYQDNYVFVRVKQVSGAGGDGSEKCSWGYDAWPLMSDTGDDNQRVVVDGQPLYGRSDYGEYDAAADNTLALARYVYGCTLLFVLDEVYHFGECDCTP